MKGEALVNTNNGKLATWKEEVLSSDHVLPDRSLAGEERVLTQLERRNHFWVLATEGAMTALMVHPEEHVAKVDFLAEGTGILGE